MLSIFKIIRKNLKLLLRSKSSALIVILGPLLVIFLVGIAFNNSETYSVRIGTYSGSYSELSEQIIANLAESSFKVDKYPSEEECIGAIKQAKIHTCMVFSDGLTAGVDGKNEIMFHIDYSKINLVWMILDAVSSQVESKSTELSKDLSGILLSKIEFTQNEVKADKATLLLLTNEQNNIKKNIEGINTDLSGLSLNMPKSASDVRFVENQTLTMAVLSGYMVDHTKKMFVVVKNGLAAINSSSPGTNVTYMKQVVEETEFKVNSIYGKLANKSANVTLLMNDLASAVGDAKTKLEAAGNTRTKAYEQITSIKNSLDQSITSLASIQASFDKIDETLSNIQVKEAGDIAAPIKTSVKPVTSESTHLNYMFPSLIVMVIMFISILLSSTFVIMDKRSKAYFRNFITPTKDIVFVMGTYLTTMFLMIIQLVVILLVAQFAFKADVLPSLLNTSIILIVIASVFTLIGMVVGYAFKSEETSTLAAISTGSVLLFLSGVILPLESMPYYVMQVAQYNPFVLSELLLRKTLIFNAAPETLGLEFGIMMGFILVLFIGVLILQKLVKRHYLSKYAKKLVPKKKEKKK